MNRALPLIAELDQKSPHANSGTPSPVHGDRMPEDAAISIAVRPVPRYPWSERRRLSQEDFGLVAAWLVRNAPIIVDYWNTTIDTNEFRQRIAANDPPG